MRALDGRQACADSYAEQSVFVVLASDRYACSMPSLVIDGPNKLTVLASMVYACLAVTYALVLRGAHATADHSEKRATRFVEQSFISSRPLPQCNKTSKCRCD
jgi:hypothetical protein